VKYNLIEAFRAVMLTGSMTEAAELLCTSQPGISRRIAQLERETKLVLFIRGSKRLQPTAEAIAFYREVERTFTALENLSETAKAIRTFGTGHIRIACLPALGLGFLPRVISRFKRDHPDVSITLQTRSSSTVVEWTAAHQCDIGLAAKGAEAKGVDAELFLSVLGACILPPGHPLAKLPVIRPHDLAGLDFISLGLVDSTRAKIDRIFEEAGVERRLGLETQYAATVCSCVLEGLGVSIVNPFVPPDYLGRGLIMRPFLPEVRIEKLLMYPKGRPKSALVDAFVALMKHCRDEELAAQKTFFQARPMRALAS
jgi:DNA-binding transcriptional LysR family regulator